MQLRVGTATHRGRVREHNEDSFASRADQGLFIVCDGMGGAAAGEVASRMAVDDILAYLDGDASGASAEPRVDGQTYRVKTTRLGEALRRSNDSIYQKAQSDPALSGMGTTVVAVWIDDQIASIAHVGDSRAYLFQKGRLEPITIDHSLVEAQVRAGLIDREQSKTSAHQNILLRALGREADVEVEYNELPLRPGDYLLLCTDGLTRMVPDAAMAEAIAQLRQPQPICDHLIDAANKNGGRDNVTVIVVEVVDHGWRRWWHKKFKFKVQSSKLSD